MVAQVLHRHVASEHALIHGEDIGREVRAVEMPDHQDEQGEHGLVGVHDAGSRDELSRGERRELDGEEQDEARDEHHQATQNQTDVLELLAVIELRELWRMVAVAKEIEQVVPGVSQVLRCGHESQAHLARGHADGDAAQMNDGGKRKGDASPPMDGAGLVQAAKEVDEPRGPAGLVELLREARDHQGHEDENGEDVFDTAEGAEAFDLPLTVAGLANARTLSSGLHGFDLLYRRARMRHRCRRIWRIRPSMIMGMRIR